MGRAKLNLKKIEHNATRHVTFAKRKSGLRKKTNQLSILCDADVAVMLFSSTGRLSCFSGDKMYAFFFFFAPLNLSLSLSLSLFLLKS
ncbi:Agamous-like MADS-box protein AGL16 [Acorus gramineus]|uniref:Agamous-like MADS-box protein AGL16 n=1 Tax=Acorus gramineus TaxID=55184 RepID=A0AAV9ARH0_ACOGR|nr:Agamous-like MADS-box protein AGL16 [Acorus gramineus]